MPGARSRPPPPGPAPPPARSRPSGPAPGALRRSRRARSGLLAVPAASDRGQALRAAKARRRRAPYQPLQSEARRRRRPRAAMPSRAASPVPAGSVTMTTAQSQSEGMLFTVRSVWIASVDRRERKSDAPTKTCAPTLSGASGSGSGFSGSRRRGRGGRRPRRGPRRGGGGRSGGRGGRGGGEAAACTGDRGRRRGPGGGGSGLRRPRPRRRRAAPGRSPPAWRRTPRAFCRPGARRAPAAPARPSARGRRARTRRQRAALAPGLDPGLWAPATAEAQRQHHAEDQCADHGRGPTINPPGGSTAAGRRLGEIADTWVHKRRNGLCQPA